MTITAASTSRAPSTSPAVDRRELEARVKAMYREVAETPEGDFHFEMGWALAERLGYDPNALDRIPAAAIESAGFGVQTLREHSEYRFLTESARGASQTYGVKSISLLAIKR